MTTPIANIGQISIRVHDVERAVAFYRDALGLEFLFDAGPLAPLSCGNVRLMLTTPERDEFDHPSSTLYFRVDDIHAAREELVERGVPFEDEPHLIGEDARPRALDDLLPRSRQQPARADERGQVAEAMDQESSSP